MISLLLSYFTRDLPDNGDFYTQPYSEMLNDYDEEKEFYLNKYDS